MNTRLTEPPFYGSVMRTREVSDFRLMEVVYPANTRVPKHSHEQAILWMVLNGKCSEVYGSRLREYAPLTVEFLPPNEAHSLDFPPQGLRGFGVDIAPQWLKRTREYSLFLDTSVHSQGGLLAGLCMNLHTEFRQMDGASSLAIEGLMLEILAHVSRRQVKASDRTPPRWLDQALQLLREQFSEHLTIAHIATCVGVHPVHLAREFRKARRCTIGEYIRQLRIEHACRELRGSDSSLAAIASGAGFSDQSHFSRTFKRFMDMTPAQYRAAFSRR